MGCDIHAIIEKRGRYTWINKGDPDIGRNYELFAVLANVRNEDGIPCIAEPRGAPRDCSSAFRGWLASWEGDAHSASWVTLAEMKAYNVEQEFQDSSLILSIDEESKQVTSTCRWTSGGHLGPVGKRKVFALWGRKVWTDLIAKMEEVRGESSDEDVRLVFFFDN